MKKQYVTPRIYGEEFVANEYVAACWNIKCNVPTGFGYIEKNGKPGYQHGDEMIVSDGNRGCGTEHVAKGIDAAGPKANAMWQPQRKTVRGYENDGDPYEVFYFHAIVKEWNNTNHHFCTLDSVNWEKNPNASN